jgi:uncharacterized Zn finger protein
MSKPKKLHPLVRTIEQSLAPGAFIAYGRSWDFVRNLDGVKDQLDAMVKADRARQAVELYETFLAACYDKADEIDDSGGSLGDFFQGLFVSWIHARQRAGCPAEDTIRCVLRWIDHDNYGFCHDIEGAVAKVLDRCGLALFKAHLEQQLDAAFVPFKTGPPQCIHDYPWAVRKPVHALKAVYLARNDLRAYTALCERFLVSPKDCANIATLCEAKKRPADALAWVERGLAAEQDRNWGNESSYELRGFRQKLLAKVGRRDEALESAWADFARHPSAYSYADFMRYVPRNARDTWHQRAMQQAETMDLRGFIEICVETKEWEQLATRVVAAAHEQLESISHYVTEKAAQGLARKHPPAAAQIYRALAMRILKAGKSKYYSFALEHLRTAKRLYDKLGEHGQWQTIVDEIRGDHARKRGFVAAFEEIAANSKVRPPESFADRSRRRWKQQTAD